MKNYIKTKSLSPQEALAKMMRFCSYQDRCTAEVEEKLKEAELSQQEIDQIVDHLIDEKFLDDERFLRSFVLGKFRQKGWGKIKIKAALRLKKIVVYKIEEALNLIPEDEYLVQLEKYAQRKLQQLNEDDLSKKKEKLYRHLLSKGYESNLIMAIL